MELQEAKQAVDKAVSSEEFLIVIGTCRVKYTGRAVSKLAEGERAVIVKGDGSFLVHQNKNLKAINYQPPDGVITTEINDDQLVVRASRRNPEEVLEAKFSEVKEAKSFDMDDDNSLKMFGTEEELSNLLMQDLEHIEKGLRPIKNESPLSKGKIDVFARDKERNNVVIEVKRRKAGLDAVTQLKRYVEEVDKRKEKNTRGIICAPGITPNACDFLEEEGFEFYEMDYEVHNPGSEIKGLKGKQRMLKDFDG